MKIEKLASLSVKIPWWFKVFLLLVVVVLVIMAASTSAKGQEVPSTSRSSASMAVGLPPTSAPASTAETPLEESSPITGGRPEKATVTSVPDVQIDVVPFLGPELSNPESGVVIERLIEDYLAGNLRLGRGYVLCNGRVYWTDTIMGAGFDTIKQLIVARSKGGGNDISLDQIIVKATSLPGGVLSGTYSVPSGYGYGPNAIGIKADGTRITSGPGDQKVQKILFATQLPQFIGGETEAGQKAVKDWVQSNGLSITYEVMIRGNEQSKRYATVSTGPWVKIVQTKPGVVTVSAETGNSFLYNLFYSPTVDGPFTNKVATGYGLLEGSSMTTNNAGFFLLKRAP